MFRTATFVGPSSALSACPRSARRLFVSAPWYPSVDRVFNPRKGRHQRTIAWAQQIPRSRGALPATGRFGRPAAGAHVGGSGRWDGDGVQFHRGFGGVGCDSTLEEILRAESAILLLLRSLNGSGRLVSVNQFAGIAPRSAALRACPTLRDASTAAAGAWSKPTSRILSTSTSCSRAGGWRRRSSALRRV